jgi:hypothetical protein
MSRIRFSIEPRFLRIPTNWVRYKGVAYDEDGKGTGRFVERTEYFFAPEVDHRALPELIEDPWKLRNDFLKMKHSEDAALQFLSKIGVWKAVDGQEPQSNLPKTALAGNFGLRWFHGCARPLTLEELWADQEHWKELLSRDGRAKLRAKFTPPRDGARPGDKIEFALGTQFGNTLPVHMEWKIGRQYPYAVIQPMTGWELLIATTWIDLVRGAKIQVCENCGTPFRGRKRKHCSESCAHAVAVRAFRARQKKQRKSLR